MQVGKLRAELKELAENRSTSHLHAAYIGRFLDIENQTNLRSTEREQLLDAVNKIVEEKDQAFKIIIMEMAKGRPDSFINPMIDKVQKSETDLKTKLDKFQANEDALASRVFALSEDVRGAVIATGMAIGQKPTL